MCEDGATRPAYRRINAVIRDLHKEALWIDPLAVKVIGPEDPIAKAVVSVRDRHAPRIPTWFRGNRLGTTPIEEACIYPPSVAG